MDFKTMSSKDFRKISMSLSKILRHQALNMGLKMSPEGYVKIDDILQLPQMKGVTIEILEHIVENNNKKRFTIEGDSIRANQGHSIELEKPILTKITLDDVGDYPIVIHGTYREHLPSIKKDGLNKMSRTHVHFATGMPKEDGVISGMRGSCDTVIHLDLEKALQPDPEHPDQPPLEFFISSNGVILCEGPVPAKFFKKITDRKTGEEI